MFNPGIICGWSVSILWLCSVIVRISLFIRDASQSLGMWGACHAGMVLEDTVFYFCPLLVVLVYSVA